ncbi:MAG: DNA gyrase inhibitor YacG [Beijerinckiaceae bacterium]|nr:DNA gyrase inhibitor YacG [Beijerinckiaceae bacterium]
MSDAEGPSKASSLKPCPICGKPAQEKWKPFCSKRCADVDLNRWLTGRYAVPASEDDDEAERISGEGDREA